MTHVVLKRFTWCPDGSGIKSEDVVAGDERDFGGFTQSLIDEGYIAALEAGKQTSGGAGAGGENTPDYDKMSRADLNAEAARRGIDIKAAKNRGDVIALLTSQLDEPKLEDLTDDELLELAVERGIDIPAETDRAGVIAALEAGKQD